MAGSQPAWRLVVTRTGFSWRLKERKDLSLHLEIERPPAEGPHGQETEGDGADDGANGILPDVADTVGNGLAARFGGGGTGAGRDATDFLKSLRCAHGSKVLE